MRSAFALVLAPVFALGDQSTAYSVVQWSCEHQNTLPGHAFHALFLAGTLVLAALAWTELGPLPSREDARSSTRPFLAAMGVASALFSALVIAALWLPQWVVSPCFG
ncbi:MAG TPA: hypothetical protein VH040_00135 [Usitatibacter sp.]|jgi:hypothetical protein|nr:hypothetical protein [Usitatibacter sp.]